MTSRLIAALAILASLLMTGCGTLARPDGPMRISPDQIVRVADPRIGANDTAKLQALAAEMETRLGAAGQGQTILALSGGGANGAYGAGLIVGWTQKGDRPTFDIVTGVSTGALAAPFAYLGPQWDDALRKAYTDGGTSGLLSPRMLATFVNPSLFSSRVLRALVDDNVTPELLQAISLENAKGRKLLVATTNLDTEETVIWDMGLLASQGGDDALSLFRDVLVSSASIPGVFPPVLIAGIDAEGQVVQEMHVDGGVNTPFLAIPEDMLLWTNPAAPDLATRGQGGSLYVVVNGQIGRNTGVTGGRISDILARTYDSMSKASLRTSLTATAAFAGRNHIAMSMAAIPDNVEASSLKFDTTSMRALFELGRSRAANDEAWAAVAPSSHAIALPSQQAAPDQIPIALQPKPDQPSGVVPGVGADEKSPAGEDGAPVVLNAPKP